MKPTKILLGLSLITNINQPILNNQKLTPDLSIKNIELVEKSSFDTLATKNFSELSGYENEWLIQNSERPITASSEACHQVYVSAIAGCSYIFWNPPLYAACMAAATAAYAACLAASS